MHKKYIIVIETLDLLYTLCYHTVTRLLETLPISLPRRLPESDCSKTQG